MTNITLRLKRMVSFLPLTLVLCTLFVSSCKKNHDETPSPVSYSPEVLDKWMTIQLRLMRNATGIPNQAFSRPFAYSGVTALEALTHAPGVKRINWNSLTGMPAREHRVKYYDPASVNAALATINRLFFPNASPADKQAIDSLEQAISLGFSANHPQSNLTSSAAFGKAVAQAVFSWSETDGHKLANNPYTPPVGPGLWVPTPPAFGNASTPYWGQNRTIAAGSLQNIHTPPPPPYSAHPGSPFYEMVKQVFDASKNLTDDQKAMAIFWRDVPGATSPGHWLSIVQQVIKQSGTGLHHGVLAYALTGIAVNDALISVFKTKYQYNLVRPVTYIREVMGQANWSSFLGTPGHPEYSSAHAVLSSAAAEILETLFGKNYSFTDHTYDYLGLAPRSYSSFRAIGEEAGQSRLYAGIHYQVSIDAGLVEGRLVARNILTRTTLMNFPNH